MLHLIYLVWMANGAVWFGDVQEKFKTLEECEALRPMVQLSMPMPPGKIDRVESFCVDKKTYEAAKDMIHKEQLNERQPRFPV